MRRFPTRAASTTPQLAASGRFLTKIGASPDFSVKAIDFIEFLSAFFVIDLSQTRMNACDKPLTHDFYTKLSTYFVGYPFGTAIYHQAR
jgi:hypothetical protein